MALTLNGSTRWPGAKELRRLGETRLGASPARVRRILQRIEAAMAQTAVEVSAYVRDHPEFAETGQRMLKEWATGSSLSLRD